MSFLSRFFGKRRAVTPAAKPLSRPPTVSELLGALSPGGPAFAPPALKQEQFADHHEQIAREAAWLNMQHRRVIKTNNAHITRDLGTHVESVKATKLEGAEVEFMDDASFQDLVKYGFKVSEK